MFKAILLGPKPKLIRKHLVAADNNFLISFKKMTTSRYSKHIENGPTTLSNGVYTYTFILIILAVWKHLLAAHNFCQNMTIFDTVQLSDMV